jgi:hypothetical protein
VATVVAGCYLGPGPDHYAAILDELAVPAGWQLLETRLRGPGQEEGCDPMLAADCPSATRWFLVGVEPAPALDAATSVIERARFQVARTLFPACDGAPTGPACGLESRRASDVLWVKVYPPGRTTGLDADVDGTTVAFTAQR